MYKYLLSLQSPAKPATLAKPSVAKTVYDGTADGANAVKRFPAVFDDYVKLFPKVDVYALATHAATTIYHKNKAPSANNIKITVENWTKNRHDLSKTCELKLSAQNSDARRASVTKQTPKPRDEAALKLDS